MMGIDYINEEEQDGDGDGDGDVRTSVAYNHEGHALILMAVGRQGRRCYQDTSYTYTMQ